MCNRHERPRVRGNLLRRFWYWQPRPIRRVLLPPKRKPGAAENAIQESAAQESAERAIGVSAGKGPESVNAVADDAGAKNLALLT